MKRYVSILLVIIMTVALLAGCGGGSATADAPGKLSSGGDFAKWFQEGKGSAISGKTQPETFYFQLGGNVTVSNTGLINNGHTVIIDLNGYTLTAKNSQVFSVDGGKLTLKNGTVQSAGADTNGGVIAVTGENSALELDGVKLANTDDSSISAQRSGGVIYVSGNEAAVIIKGDSQITGSAAGKRDSGGAVALAGNSRLYMLGGSITGGNAGVGGNIYATDTAQVYISGGSVADGKAVQVTNISGDGGNIAISGQAQVHLLGGSITGGNAVKSGGNIYVNNAGTGDKGFYQYGGTVEAGSAKEGGNIYAMGKQTMVSVYGGQVQGGDATNGGNVYLMAAALQMRGGAMKGLQENETIASGGNIYSAGGTIELYDGTISHGWTKNSGGNIYGADTTVTMYGGKIIYGTTDTTGNMKGGGNLFLAGESVLDLYDGEISGGECNRSGRPDSSSAGNIMIMENTKMQMFGGAIRNGILKGQPCRCGSLMVNGLAANCYTYFHMYGGVMENDALPTADSRGHILGAYSNTGNTSGQGFVRIFDGDIRYTGDNEAMAKFTLWSRKGFEDNPVNLVIYNADKYKGLYQTAVTGACKDGSHNTFVADVEATCVTPGYTQYHCNTCGDWCKITSEATGHSVSTTVVEATELVAGYTQHVCADCGVIGYSDMVAPIAAQ